jgi:hypothetical protein
MDFVFGSGNNYTYSCVHSCTSMCGNLRIFNAGQHVDLRFLTGISYLKKVPATSDLLKFALGRQAINLVL